MHTILGIEDSVNTCDCCGKTGLKFTFAVEVDGDVLHYGSVCVKKWTGMTAAQANKAIATREAEEKARKEKLLSQTAEAINYQAKWLEAMNIGLIGKAFKEYCSAEYAALQLMRAKIFA